MNAIGTDGSACRKFSIWHLLDRITGVQDIAFCGLSYGWKKSTDSGPALTFPRIPFLKREGQIPAIRRYSQVDREVGISKGAGSGRPGGI
jgi:hypothetical protein